MSGRLYRGRSVFLIARVREMTTRDVHLTREGQMDLETELEHLQTVRRREVATRIHKANESGGTVDNAEYEDAKNEQAFVEGRISELETILSNAVVASGRSRSKSKKGAVQFGSSVTVVTHEGKSQKYMVVGSAEADPLKGKISIESPVGQALQGHKAGDKVDVETPSGVVKLSIKKVS